MSLQSDHPSPHVGYCKRKDDASEPNNVPLLEECGMLKEIMSNLDYVVSKSDTLVFNMTNNQAERFNSIVAKLISGKRIDHAKRGAYRGRVFGAGIAHCSGPSWHLSPLKKLSCRSPGKYTKRELIRRQKKGLAASRRLLVSGPIFKKKPTGGPDKDYGLLAAQEDLPEEEFNKKYEHFLEKQKSEVDSFEKQCDIQVKTKGQFECALWRQLRQDRLTASNFGSIIQRRLTTSCHKMVERMLYTTYDLSKNKNITFGRQHEKTAIAKYEQETGHSVSSCGIFIDVDHPYLGASPDGLIDFNGVIEVKTLPSIGNNTIAEAMNEKKSICLEKIPGGMQLKRKHKYYYQVQGQLAITRREYCDLVVYARNDYFVERIHRDESLWENTMLPLLTEFYMQCLLPEIIDPRIPRGLEIRENQSFLQARVAQQEQKQRAIAAKIEKTKRKKTQIK